MFAIIQVLTEAASSVTLFWCALLMMKIVKMENNKTTEIKLAALTTTAAFFCHVVRLRLPPTFTHESPMKM